MSISEHIQPKKLIISLVISLGVGIVSAIITYDSMSQYEQLYKPLLAPPGVVFPIVWTILFVLMGIASYIVATSGSDSEQKNSALRLYALQLAANFMWSVIFFRYQAYLLAFTWLLLLWYLILLTTVAFYEIDKKAGKLMLPYLLWVTFAGYLNLAITIYYMTHR